MAHSSNDVEAGPSQPNEEAPGNRAPRPGARGSLPISDEMELKLVVLDARFDGKPPRILRLVFDDESEKLENVLNQLPKHEEGVARIFDFAHDLNDNQKGTLRNYLNKSYLNIPCGNSFDLSPRGAGMDLYDIDAISTQWGQPCEANGQKWVKSWAYRDMPDGLHNFNMEDGTYLSCLATEENDKLIVLHQACSAAFTGRVLVENARIPRKFLASSLMNCDSSILLNTNPSTAAANSPRVQFTKLLLLKFLRRSLSWWTEQLKRLFKDTTQSGYGVWGYRTLYNSFTPQSDIVKDMLESFLGFERVMDVSRELADAIEYALLSLSTTGDESVALRDLTVDIRTRSELQTKMATLLQDRCNQRYEFFLKNLSINDSVGLKRLTILAALYLPLSLASSILSMSTRFKDLNLLLYDFVGVFCIITSFTILSFFVISIYTKLSRVDKSQLRRKYSPWKVRWWSSEVDDDEAEYAMGFFFKYAFLFCVGAIISASFIVGMLARVTTGLRVLGYGFGALLGGIFFLLPIILSVVTSLSISR